MRCPLSRRDTDPPTNPAAKLILSICNYKNYPAKWENLEMPESAMAT